MSELAKFDAKRSLPCYQCGKEAHMMFINFIKIIKVTLGGGYMKKLKIWRVPPFYSEVDKVDNLDTCKDGSIGMEVEKHG